MDAAKIKKRARAFISRWEHAGKETADYQRFWLDLLQNVYVVEDALGALEFQKTVRLKHASYIDCYIPATKVLIEQKNSQTDLTRKQQQSDGAYCTPYEQAKRYADALPLSEKPRFIVICNFRQFLVYDQEHPQDDPYSIELADLEDDWPRLSFLVSLNEVHLQRQVALSVQAGTIVGKIYDALQNEYADPDHPDTLRSLNILCVRLVFCLYAEDAGLFRPAQFCDFIENKQPEHLRRALLALFEVLNTPEEQRNIYIEQELKGFPYVNGSLFADQQIEIPAFTEEIKQLLTEDAGERFNWSKISPTIFGAIFESTLNPQSRRSGGMHYTSVENIHRVIDPLFLDELNHEFAEIEQRILGSDQKRDAKGGGRLGLRRSDQQALQRFQDKLAALCFLDPACGSGNFLTESFLALRRLENKVLLLLKSSNDLFIEDRVKVSIEQFYGIEINDFAVSVAKAALWIAEAQMLEESNAILTRKIDFLPLSSYANIREGSALPLDWLSLNHGEPYDYIISNPPFVGYGFQDQRQKQEILDLYRDENGKSCPRAGKIDYAAGWFFKAAELMNAYPHTKTALVSTNSLTQGDQVSAVWQPLYERFHLQIDFAYQSFKWDSESLDKAAVHVVIIGMSCTDEYADAAAPKKSKTIFTSAGRMFTDNISPYLRPEPTVFIANRSTPLCPVPPMFTGNRPADGGHLILNEDEYQELIRREPGAKSWIKKLTGSKEYINAVPRYCLWLEGASPAQLKALPLVCRRVELCRQARLAGAPDRQKLADTPTLFRETFNPDRYLIVPATSSHTRAYIPIGFLAGDTIATNSALIIPEAGLYEFSILSSRVHVCWVSAVAGRLKSDYRYSKDLVYNNFPWPQRVDSELKSALETASQKILDARAQYPDSSLAALYDPTLMPTELCLAHQHNDELVLRSYGLNAKAADETVLSTLFKCYQVLSLQTKEN